MWLHADVKVLPDIVRHRARVMPEKTALIEGSRRVTFGQLDTETNRVAHAVARDGAKPGAVVAFAGKNSIPFFEILFGASKAGCTVLPLNWRLAPAELIPIIDDALPALMFVDKEFAPLVDKVLEGTAQRCKVVPFDSTAPDSGLAAWCADVPCSDPGLPADPQAIALLMYTSGTTGRAKGVQMTHQGVSYMRLCESLEPAMQ